MNAFEFGRMMKRAASPFSTNAAAPKPPAARANSVPRPTLKDRTNVPVDMSGYPTGHNSAAGPQKATSSQVMQILKDNPLANLSTLNLPNKQMMPAHGRDPAAGMPNALQR